MGSKDLYFFGYVGSKRRVMHKIVPLFPSECSTYYEGCGGSGYMALNLPSFEMPKNYKASYKPFDRIVYNEFNAHVCRLFELMKNPDTNRTLIEKLSNMEWNEENFKKCHESYKNDFADISDDIQKAVMTYALIVQSRYNAMGSFEKSKKPLNSDDLRQRLERVADALEQNHIEISNIDCFKLVEAHYDDPSCFIYLDPPYLGQNRYKLEWTFTKHTQLAEFCNDAKCKIMISSRENGIYNEVLARYKPENDVWHKYYIGSFKKPQSSADADVVGAYVYEEGFVSPDEFINDEYVYTNYNAFANLEACGIREYNLFSSRLGQGDEPIMIEGNAPIPVGML